MTASSDRDSIVWLRKHHLTETASSDRDSVETAEDEILRQMKFPHAMADQVNQAIDLFAAREGASLKGLLRWWDGPLSTRISRMLEGLYFLRLPILEQAQMRMRDWLREMASLGVERVRDWDDESTFSDCEIATISECETAEVSDCIAELAALCWELFERWCQVSCSIYWGPKFITLKTLFKLFFYKFAICICNCFFTT